MPGPIQRHSAHLSLPGRARVTAIVTLLILAAGGVFLGIWVFRPSPAGVARQYLAAWKSHDSGRVQKLITHSEVGPGQADAPTAMFRNDLARQAASKLQFRSLKVAGPAVVDRDIATVPAVAEVDGGSAVRTMAAIFPVPASIEKQAAAALNHSFRFRVGLEKDGGVWRVNQQSTVASLVSSVLADPRVKGIQDKLKAGMALQIFGAGSTH